MSHFSVLSRFDDLTLNKIADGYKHYLSIAGLRKTHGLLGGLGNRRGRGLPNEKTMRRKGFYRLLGIIGSLIVYTFIPYI
jgi:hypothetical protein